VDPYGLADSEADIRPSVWFGDVDASSALVGGQTNNAINTMASATIQLDARTHVLSDIDFTSEVVIARGDREVGRVFTGYVVEATTKGQVIELECQSSPSLREPMSGGRVSKTFPVDAIYAVLREGGVPESRMQLAGLDQLPTEVFEAVTPVGGLVLSSRVVLGDVVFLPAGSAVHVTEPLEAPESSDLEEFQNAETYAVTYVTASRSYDAEMAAIERIEAAVAWANVRIRFAGAMTLAGQVHGWHRSRLKQLATRTDLIALRGLVTNRCWLHHIARPSMTELALATEGGGTAALVESDAGLRSAVKAVSRAISSADPLTAITAISECLEFYAGSTDAPYGFTKTERRALLRVARQFSVDKRARVAQMCGLLNEAPLMRRLRYQLAEDGVPMSNAEMETIGRVRSQRNDVVHGRTDTVDRADIQQAVALLARIMVYASERRLAKQQGVDGSDSAERPG
jgi:hypothetical protein